MLEGRPLHWDDSSIRSSSLTSVFADELIVTGLVPFACPSDFGPGERYRLEELVFANARSLVYRAKDSRLSDQGFHATVAVKVFRPGKDRSHEALTGRRISHANVLRILDRGVTEDDHAFVVSEYVDGGDLSAKPGPWDPKDAARFMVKLCRGVQAAHAAGVVHCDLKPANVMLTKDGEPKLADFDLARSESNPSDMARGNIAFMSPEQYEGKENSLAPPADIYALGGILWTLLTGKAPHGETASQVEAFHAARALPASTVGGKTLDRIVHRAMRREIAERYPSAAQMADDLESWLAHRPIEWMQRSAWQLAGLWSIRHPGRAVAVGAASLALVAGLWTWRAMVERDHKRELEAQATIVRKADEKVEEIKGKVRTQIRSMISMINPNSAADLDQRLLPTLTWIEWLTDDPVISASGEIAAVPERIKLLQEAITLAEADGRSAHLDTMMKRYALSQLLIGDNRSAEAGPVLDTLDAWLASLPGDEPVRLSVRAMHACVDAEDVVSQTALNVRVAKLQLIRSQVQGKPAMQRTVKMIDNVAKRLGT